MKPLRYQCYNKSGFSSLTVLKEKVLVEQPRSAELKYTSLF